MNERRTTIYLREEVVDLLDLDSLSERSFSSYINRLIIEDLSADVVLSRKRKARRINFLQNRLSMIDNDYSKDRNLLESELSFLLKEMGDE